MLSIDNLINFNKEEYLDFFIEIEKKKQLSLKHPEKNILTFARSNKISGMSNVVHFSDSELNNHWYLIQVGDFISGWVTEDNTAIFAAKAVVENQIRLIKKNHLNFNHGNTNTLLNGFIISQNRPYHFFFDQLVHVFSLRRKAENFPFFMSSESYFSSIDNCSSKIDNNGLYLFPCAKKSDYSSIDSYEMFHHIKSKCNSNNKAKNEFNLWFGITGQKRAWIEQEIACYEIAKFLEKIFNKVNIYIDGWTNPEDKKYRSLEDIEIFERIKKSFEKEKRINIHSIINSTYKEKIEVCNICDTYVSNNGSGSIVPHVFLNKKGVIHGNKGLAAFRKSYNTNCYLVPYDDVKIIDGKKNRTRDTQSYSIKPFVILGLVLKATNFEKKTCVHSIEITKCNSCKKLIERELLKHFKHELNKFSLEISPELLRDLSLVFENTGDLVTAQKIMEKAFLQKPHGPFIKDKLTDYDNRINSKGINKNENP